MVDVLASRMTHTKRDKKTEAGRPGSEDAMTSPESVHEIQTPVPYESVVPYLNVLDADAAVAFYEEAFGADVVVSLRRHGGKVAHAELRIGAATFMLRDEYPEYRFLSPSTIGGTAVNLLVYVPDVEQFARRASDAGAIVIRPVEKQFHGDLMVELEDPYGHSWFFATRIEPMTTDDLRDNAAAAQL